MSCKGQGTGTGVPAMWGSLCAWAEMCLRGGSFLRVGVHRVCRAPHSSPPTWPLAPPSWDHHLLCTWDAPITSKQGQLSFQPHFTRFHAHCTTNTHPHPHTGMRAHTCTHVPRPTCIPTHPCTYKQLPPQPGCPSNCPHLCPEASAHDFHPSCLWSAPTLSLGPSSPLSLPS